MYTNCSIEDSLDDFGEKICLHGHCVWMKSSEVMTAVKQCFCEKDWQGKRCTYYDPFPLSLGHPSIIAISLACIFILLIVSIVVVFKVLKVYCPSKIPKMNDSNNSNNYQKCNQNDNKLSLNQET